MEIRDFQTADTDAVVALWEVCGLTRPWNNPSLDIERKCSVNDGLFLVGEISRVSANELNLKHNLVATIMGGYEGHRGWINYLAVHPKMQRRGLGQILMQDIESRLLALGCPKINLQIRRENSAVMAFYESLGFTEDAAVSLGKRIIPDN